MRTHFHINKAIQAVAFLLRQEPSHGMNCGRLLRLLYLAEREKILETATTLTGGKPVVMDKGTTRLPHIEEVHLLLSGVDEDPSWGKYIGGGYERPTLERDPGFDDLCRYDLRKLGKVWVDHLFLDDDELADKLCGLAEVREADFAAGPVIHLDWGAVLRENGKDDLVRVMEADYAEEAFIDGLVAKGTQGAGR